MKLKLIALATLLATTGAANAQISINNGAQGNGELFFTLWNAQKSYTFDLNTTIDSFEASIGAAGTGTYVTKTLDSVFNTFMTGVNASSLIWNIVATDSLGASRTINTYTTLPAGTMARGTATNAAGAITGFVNAVNTQTPFLEGVDSAVFNVGNTGYADLASGVRFGTSNGGNLNFNNSGTVLNNSYATGLNVLRVNANSSGTVPSVYTPYADGGFAVRAYFNEDLGTVTISAVPEPGTYAMLLAGLGLMGAIARRRRQG